MHLEKKFARQKRTSAGQIHHKLIRKIFNLLRDIEVRQKVFIASLTKGKFNRYAVWGLTQIDQKTTQIEHNQEIREEITEKHNPQTIDYMIITGLSVKLIIKIDKTEILERIGSVFAQKKRG